MRAAIVALGAALSVLPLAVEANPIAESQIYSLLQNGEDIEIVTKHQYLTIGTECIWLVRQTADGDLKIVVDEVSMLVQDYDEECGFYCSADAGPDPEYCAEHPDECEDCDEDDVPECPGPCEASACELTHVDHCVPPGEVTYTLYSTPDPGCELDCSRRSYESLEVNDVGQSCPAICDEFECIESAGCEGDGGDEEGCSVSGVGSDAEAGGLGFLMLGLGVAALLVSRRRRG